jgi:methylenetetrahydrofolate reductase (NADPH)
MARIADLLARGRTSSFEFFPPKTDAGWLTLGRTIAELEPLHPDFVSVTYGAGGSTRDRTHQLTEWIGKETSITPMAHLTCQGHTRAEIAQIVGGYVDAGVENIMALGGDPPKDPADARPSDYRYAMELVEDVRAAGDFCVGVAAHPELHPRSPDRANDRRRLAEKLELADFAVTQFFFEVRHYMRLVDELAALGCTKPVVPGIMPVTNVAQVGRMAELAGAEFPQWLADELTRARSPEEMRRVGVEAATQLCIDLLEVGAPGLHFYTLNRSSATREIHANLGLGRHPVTPL